jgi:uracil DNA glycosylase
MDEPNSRVLKACIELAINLECDKYLDHGYCIPFIRYLSLFPYSLPIKTILVGQNPYPQEIYPEYGSALAYDESKVYQPPASVRVLAEDLYNYAEIPKDDTIRCFRDSWMLATEGIIAINETVFSRLTSNERKTNMGPMKEAEFQVRMLEVMIAESYAMGQQKIDCVAMGMSAQMMCSLLREWCPNDLVKFKLVSCSNPAAFAPQLRDRESQTITLRKDTASKILAGVVNTYVNMPPKYNKVDARLKQNEDSLRKSTDDVVSTGRAVTAEYSSFAARLQKVSAIPEAKAAIEDLDDAMGNLVKAIDRNATATSAQTLTFIMFANSIKQNSSKPESVGGTSTSGRSIANLPVPTPAAPRAPVRRTIRPNPNRVATAPEIKSETIDEEPITAVEAPVTPLELPVAPSASGRRRVVRRASSRAPSVADSEYTTVGGSTEITQGSGQSTDKISVIEKVHMNSFAMWFSNSVDSTYGQMLETAGSEGMANSMISRKVLGYIRGRIEKGDYDAYIELFEGDSATSDTTKWCEVYAKELTKD